MWTSIRSGPAWQPSCTSEGTPVSRSAWETINPAPPLTSDSLAQWANSAEVERSYASASIINAERMVFNIKGSAYRLVVAVDFEKGIVWIKWIGTHKDYDRIDVSKVKYED
jgi:mRNA-degrading endonuclease HigB of HigAB toxin-antitoxin module